MIGEQPETAEALKDMTLEAAEYQLIRQALERADGNVSEAARRLGVILRRCVIACRSMTSPLIGDASRSEVDYFHVMRPRGNDSLCRSVQ